MTNYIYYMRLPKRLLTTELNLLHVYLGLLLETILLMKAFFSVLNGISLFPLCVTDVTRVPR